MHLVIMHVNVYFEENSNNLPPGQFTSSDVSTVKKLQKKNKKKMSSEAILFVLLLISEF